MAIKQGKIITVTSMKGGTGKTTMALNLAGIIQSLGEKVLIVDLDFYGSAIASSLNLDYKSDIYKMVDDLSNNRFHQIENYVITYAEGIDVLPAPKDPRDASKIKASYLEPILNRASMRYDVLLLDTNHCMDSIKLMALDQSDETVYVMTNDPIDIKNMKSIVSIYKSMEKDNYKIVLNEALDHNRSYFDHYDIKNIIHDNIDYTIPKNFHIQNIDRYVLDGKILTMDSKIIKRYKKAMKNLTLLSNALLREKKKK